MSKQLTAKNAVAQAIPANQKTTVKMAKGQHLRVQDVLQNQTMDAGNVVATKQGQDLNLTFADGTEIQLQGFYNECGGNACSVTVAGKETSGYTINGDTAVGVSTSHGGNLVYAYGDQSSLMGMATSDASISGAIGSLGDGLVAYVPSASSSLGGITTGTLAAAGGGLGVAAGLAGGAAAGAAAAAAVGAAANNSILAHVVAGPVLSGNDLQAIVYAANGTTVLGQGTINANGSVTVQVGSYTGVVIVKVISLGANPDYMDEATGLATDLGNTVLQSVGEIVTQNGVTTLNVNALTSLAYLKAVQVAGAGQTLTSQIVTNTNAAVADAFGLTNLLGESVVTTVNTSGSSNTSYDATNGLSNAEMYGAVLAALSGADSSNGGNVQTTINNLVSNLTVSGTTGTLNSTAIDTIIAGAQTADPTNSQTLVLAASNATTQTAANLMIDSVATDNLINASETGATVSGTAAANASITLTLGNGNTQNVMADAQGHWSYTLQSGDITAMGQGPETILVSDGSNTSTRGVFVDTTLPSVSMAASTTTNANANTVSVTSSEAGTVYLVSSSVTVTSLASITGAGSALVASASAAANSASSISTVGLTAGTYHAYAVDSAGNLSLISTNAVTVVDASGAAISGVALSHDSGSSATDFITNVQTQTISGNLSVALTSNERIEISLDNGTTWVSATVTGTTFSLSNADLSNGTNFDYNDTLLARVFNTGLNAQAGATYSQAYVYDSTAVNRPDFEVALDDVAPVVLAINNLNNLSAMPGNPAVTDDNLPQLKLAFRGGANVGDILHIYDTLSGNTSQIGIYTLTSTDVSNGFFLFQTPQLADGLHSFSADTADLAGNTSSTTASFDFYIDTSGITPNAPVISSSASLTNSSPIINGTASPGHLVTVNVGGASFVTTVAANGTWSINTATAIPANNTTFTPISPGNSPLSVTVTGANGSTSTTATQTLNLSQGVATVSFSNDSGSSSTDFITSNASQTISGTVVMNLSATESVEVSLDNGSTWTTATTTTGQNTYTLAGLTLSGSNTLKVRVVDNTTPGPALSHAYVLDTSAPNAPTITSVTDNVGGVTGTVANNGSTDDTDVLVRVNLGSNNAVAGDSVRLYDGSTALGSAVTLSTQDITNGYIDIQSGTLTNGNSYALSAKITDIAGNVSNAATAHNITVDTTAPVVSITSSALSNSATPTVSGTATAGSTVTVTIGNAVYTVTATGGNWSVNTAVATPSSYTSGSSLNLNTNGNNTVTASAVNSLGVSSTGTPSQTLVIDTTAPNAPTITSVTDNVLGITGAVANNGITNDTDVLVRVSLGSNNAFTGDSVRLYDGSTALGSAVTLSSQDISNGYIDIQSGTLTTGNTYALSAKITDIAGNVSNAATAHNITVDTSIPVVSITSAALTNSATPTVSGTATAGSTVTVTIGNAVYTVTATGGNWSVNTAVATPSSYTSGSSLSLNANGNNTVTTSVVSVAGVSGASTPSQTLVIDTTAPNAPTITSVTDNVGSIIGAIANNGSTDDTDVLVRVSLGSNNAVAGDSIRLYDGSTALGSAVTLLAQDITNGYIDIQSGTLTNGNTYALSAKITDIAGNVSNAATAHNVTVDTSVPVVAITSAALSNSATPTVSGTATAGSTVTVTIGNAVYTVTASGGGTWSVNTAGVTPSSYTSGSSLSLNANGNNMVTASVVSVTGINGASTPSQTLAIDTTAPTVSLVSANIVPAGNASVTSSEAGTVYLVHASITPTSITDITNASGSLWNSVSVSANTATNLPASGLNLGTYYAYAVDAAGNLSLVSSNSITVEVGPVSVAFSADTGSSASDFITLTAAQTISGTLSENIQAGDVVEVSLDNGSTWTAASTTVGQNTYSLSGVTLTGSGTLQVHLIRGSVTSSPLTQAYVLDTSAPNAPTITSVTDNVGGVTGTVANNGSTDDTDVLVRVNLGSNNAVAGDSVRLYDGSTALGSAVTLSTQDITNGYIDIQSGTLTNGNSYALSAKITDIAGNVSNAATAHNISVDTTAPVVAITSAALSNNATPTVSGTATTGSTVTVTIGNAVYTVTATGGNWSVNTAVATPSSYTSGSSLSLNANGNNTVTASAVNSLGVSSTSTPSQTLVIDTTAPNAPTITSVTDNVPGITGAIANNGVTNDTDVLVRVSLGNNNAVAGDSLRLYDGSTALGSTVTLSAQDISNGYIDVQSGTLTSGSTYALSAKITDIAGNVSNAATAHNITVDTSVPVVAITSAALSNSTTPTVSGTATAGSTVTVTIGNAIYTVTATGGNWSVNTTSATPTSYTSGSSLTLSTNGNNTVTASVVSVSGVSGANTPSQTLAIDTTAPNAPSITSVTDNVGSILGTIANNGSTDDTDVLVRVSLGSNNAVAGDSVRLYDGSTALGSAVTLSTQDISIGYIDIQSGTLINGNTYALSAKITDIAGNVSNAATAHNVTVDTTAPNAPSIASITDAVGGVTGVVSSGGMTDDTAAVIRISLTGTNAVAGDVLHLHNGANAFGSAYTLTSSDVTATYVDITPANGLLVSGTTYALTATLEDAVGNVSNASSSYGLVVDTSVPSAPVITSSAMTNQSLPTITGTGLAGSSVTMSFGGVTFITTVNSQGAWSINTGQNTPNGFSINTSGTANPLSVTQTNPNGVSSSATSQSLVVDTGAPTVTLAPSATIDNTGVTSVSSTEDGVVYLINSSVTVSNLSSITGAAGHLWNSVNVLAGQSTSLAASGLRDGTYHAYAVDAAGNLSLVSTNSVVIDSALQVVAYNIVAYDSNGQVITSGYAASMSITAILNEDVYMHMFGPQYQSTVSRLTLDVGGTPLVLDASGVWQSTQDTIEYLWNSTSSYLDLDGVTIGSNAINSNGGIFTASNHTQGVTVATSNYTINPAILIDGIAPTLTVQSSTQASATLQSDELGTIYLIDSSSSFNPGSPNFQNLLPTQWKSVSVSQANSPLTVSASGLDDGTYNAYAVDQAGNWSVSSQVQFDQHAPTIRSVTLDNPNAPSTYVASASGWNTTVDVIVTFSEAVTIDTTNGNPTIDINIGGVTRTATFTYLNTWGSSREAHFSYNVVASDNDTNGVSIDAQSLALNGAVITDHASTPNPLVSTSISAVADNASVLVDNLGPQVTSVSLSATGGQNGRLNVGDVVDVVVNFDSAAYDYNNQNYGTYGSSILINVGGVLRTAMAVSGDGTNQFTYQYTIQAADTDTDGISVDANAIASGWATVNGSWTNQDITDQPYGQGLVAGQNLAVAANASLKVDNTAPTVSAVTFTGASGAQNNYLNTGDAVTFSVTMDEAIALDTTGGTPRLKLNIGGTTVYASYVAGSSTSTVLAFSYTIQSGQNDSNGIAVFQDGFELNGATLVDLAGNTATVTHAAVSDNASYMVDTTAPNVPTVTSATYNSTAARIIGGTLSGGLGTNSVDVTVNGATYVLSSSNFSGNNWSLNLDSTTATSGTLGSWADGSYNVSVNVTDLAGNTSHDASNNELTFHLSTPNAPSIATVTDSVGAITGSVAAGGISDDRNLQLHIDLTGTNAVAGDKIRLFNSTTQMGSDYTLDSQDITAGYVDLNTGNSVEAGSRSAFYAGNMSDQYYNFNAKVIDSWGNSSSASSTHQVLIDTQPPTATIVNTFVQRLATANSISGYDIQVQSTEQGYAYLLPKSFTGTSLADINTYINNGANANHWKSVQIIAANTDTTMNLDGLYNGGYRLYTVDQAGNTSVKATNWVSIYTPGDATIDLGPDGNLIFPYRDLTNASGGATSGWVYHWDKNDDYIANDADKLGMSTLNPLLSYNSAMTTASGDIDTTNHYGAVGQVEVTMPLFGGQFSGWTSTSGIGAWKAPAGASVTETDLASIFDRFLTTPNNTANFYSLSGTSSSGEIWNWNSTNWGEYWTASEVTANGENYILNHYSSILTSSTMYSGAPSESTAVHNVALMVL